MLWNSWDHTSPWLVPISAIAPSSSSPPWNKIPVDFGSEARMRKFIQAFGRYPPFFEEGIAKAPPPAGGICRRKVGGFPSVQNS